MCLNVRNGILYDDPKMHTGSGGWGDETRALESLANMQLGIVATIWAGNEYSIPSAIAVGESGVWVANFGMGKVVRIDPRTNELLSTIDIEGSPQDVTVGEGSIWVLGTAEDGSAIVWRIKLIDKPAT